MLAFNDRFSRPYAIDLTIGLASRVKRASDGRVNLFAPESIGPDGLTLVARLCADWEAAYEVLWHLVAADVAGREGYPQDAQAFADALSPECLVVARAILLREWRDFFRNLQDPGMAKNLEMHLEATTRLIETAKRRCNDPRITGMVDQMVAGAERLAESAIEETRRRLDSIGSDGPGNSPASPMSTPAA
jgi:hypothetical protein